MKQTISTLFHKLWLKEDKNKAKTVKNEFSLSFFSNINKETNRKQKIDRVIDFRLILPLSIKKSSFIALMEDRPTKERRIVKIINKALNKKGYKYKKIIMNNKYNDLYGFPYERKLQDEKNIYIIYSPNFFCSLKELSEYKCKLNEKQLKYITEEIIKKLILIHNDGLLFLNLKLKNIILDKNGGVYLSNFQFTQRMEEEHNCDIMNKNFEIYPPEIFLNKKLDQTADLYSLGVLLYELLIGYKPITAPDLYQYEKQFEQRKPYIHKDEIPETISLECIDFINRLLQKNKHHRLGVLSTRDIFMHPWFKENELKDIDPFSDSFNRLLCINQTKLYKLLYKCNKSIPEFNNSKEEEDTNILFIELR